jgi:hypothetical protein
MMRDPLHHRHWPHNLVPLRMSKPYVRPLGELFKASRPKPVSSATTRRDEKRKDVRHDNQSLASPREGAAAAEEAACP